MVTKKLADRGGIPFKTSPSFGIPEGFGSVAANTIPMIVSEKATRASAIPYDFLNAAIGTPYRSRFSPLSGSSQRLVQDLQQKFQGYVSATRDETDARRRVVHQIVGDRRVGRRGEPSITMPLFSAASRTARRISISGTSTRGMSCDAIRSLVTDPSSPPPPVRQRSLADGPLRPSLPHAARDRARRFPSAGRRSRECPIGRGHLAR